MLLQMRRRCLQLASSHSQLLTRAQYRAFSSGPLFPGKATPSETAGFFRGLAAQPGRAVNLQDLTISSAMVRVVGTSDFEAAVRAQRNFVCYDHQKAPASSGGEEDAHCSLLQCFATGSSLDELVKSDDHNTAGAVKLGPKRSEMVIAARVEVLPDAEFDIEASVDACRNALRVQTLDVLILDLGAVASRVETPDFQQQWRGLLQSCDRLRGVGALQHVFVGADSLSIDKSASDAGQVLPLKPLLTSAASGGLSAGLLAGVVFKDLAAACKTEALPFAHDHGLIRVKEAGIELVDGEGRPFLFSPRTVWNSLQNRSELSVPSNNDADYAGAVVDNIKSALDRTIHMERRFAEGRRQLSLPEDFSDNGMLWATILSQNLGREPMLQNIHEWEYIRDTQIGPSLRQSLDVLRGMENTRDLAYAYKLAMDELFECIAAALLVNEQAYGFTFCWHFACVVAKILTGGLYKVFGDACAAFLIVTG
eukprot:INCI15744.2.p1 GENE.INCI15744.2~~INCI15744.2.p1  ORF type:complete len:480 (-),score=82.43 INCI15744.2:465-1904(-)